MANTIVSVGEQRREIAVIVAHSYLQKVKFWMPDDYSLEVVGADTSEERFAVILDCIYAADLQADYRGGGQSVQLHVDTQSRQVLRELAFQ